MKTKDKEGLNIRLQSSAEMLGKYGELAQTELSAPVTGKP